ncbi:MAG: hypothetical protein R3C58_08840 [Parvularculaceae bacterium]
MNATGKAIVRDALPYKDGEARLQAPRGEYDIECKEGCIGLCSCVGENAFTLSFDAFLQHVIEGRISLLPQTA